MNIEEHKIKSGFIVPENYFEDFESRLFTEKDSTELPIIKKGFNIPEGYFENFEEKLFESKIELPIIKNGFKVPEQYFETSEDRILKQLNISNTKVISLKPNVMWISSIAATLVLMISTLLFYSSNETDELITETAYINYNEDEISDMELGQLLDEKQITELENELIYNELLN